MTTPEQGDFRAGYAAIVGRPNVGKSTLLNRMLGQKISITAAKPQTTRHQILGIRTAPGGQIVFIDTPGVHRQTPRAMNRYLNRVARAVVADVDVILWLVEAAQLTSDDRQLGTSLAAAGPPVLCVVNKIDRLKNKAQLLPFVQALDSEYHPAEILMISAEKGDGVDELEQRVLARLPRSEPIFDADEITNRSQRFLAAEFIREQVIHRTHQEIPYATTVEVERFEVADGLVRIGAVIWVEREGQKGIVIGRGGRTLKQIGTAAREQLETLLDSKVFLELWVKVREGWSDDERALQAFGYGDEQA